MNPEITFLVPVFNESANFERLWDELAQQVSLRYRALVVYDFDEDDTLPSIRRLIESGETRLELRKNPSSGVASALKAGFATVRDSPIVVLMADRSDDLSVLPRMFDLYKKGFDVVVGSRYMRGGKIIGGPRVKQTISRLAGLSLHHLRGIPITDASNSFKLYAPRVLRTLVLESSHGFEINVEITVKAWLHGFKFAEVPSVWRERTQGTSKFKLLRWLPKYFHWYLFAFLHAPASAD